MRIQETNHKTFVAAAEVIILLLYILLLPYHAAFGSEAALVGKRESASGIGFVASDAVFPSKLFIGKPSLETDPIIIQVKEHELKIPRNYLETISFMNEAVFFRILVTFPGFQGDQITTVQEFNNLTSRAAWWDYEPDNEHFIWAYNAEYLSSVEKDNKVVLSDLHKQHRVAEEYGLKKIPVQLQPGGGYYFILEPSSSNPDGIVIRCFERPPNCRSTFNLVSGLVIEYGYSRSNLPQWHTIHDKAKNLLNSFLEK